jgi:GGDEF domain-containing protein
VVAIFTSFPRRRSTVAHVPASDLPEAVRRSLPARFEAVAEALASGADPLAACAVVGRDVARDGAALGEALDGLGATFRLVTRTDPDFASTQALSVAWGEATLEYLHQISCEDPLTGLASLAHVRTRLAELYRDAQQTDVSVQSSHALVVIDVGPRTEPAAAEHTFTRTLRMVQFGEVTRAVFSGGETIGRLGPDRAVSVVPRRLDLGTSVALLRELVRDVAPGRGGVRVWIEGLPTSPDSAARLLDELAR